MSDADPEARELRLGWVEERVDGLERRLEQVKHNGVMLARLEERIAALATAFERLVRQQETRAQNRLTVRLAEWGWAIAILLAALAIITSLLR